MSTPQTSVIADRLDVDGSPALGLVTLNRPAEMNPLDWETVRELGRVLDDLASDPVIRVIAITGAGRAFSAGGDMKKYQTLQRDADQFPRFLSDIHEVFGRISQYPKPVVALVNGIAVAGGIELVLFCDFAFMAESARIGDAHLPFGQMGGGGVLTMLPRVVGPSRARELIVTGRLLKADEALAWGLVSRVVADGGLVAAAIELTREVAKKSPLALGNAKRTLNAAFFAGTDVDAGLRIEREVTARYCLTSSDAPEGLDAFAAKRTPRWAGR
ncbi:MAG TPA: enoyl-CoA hydratase/isomerase family protein [Streptosporangiaceae bacterium]|nr:enoyl-CoA hydratase/isomerase family protein [Streptosporangiaceae bacterium]